MGATLSEPFVPICFHLSSYSLRSVSFGCRNNLADNGGAVLTTTSNVDVKVGASVVIDIVSEGVDREDAVLVLLTRADDGAVAVVGVDPDLTRGVLVVDCGGKTGHRVATVVDVNKARQVGIDSVGKGLVTGSGLAKDDRLDRGRGELLLEVQSVEQRDRGTERVADGENGGTGMCGESRLDLCQHRVGSAQPGVLKSTVDLDASEVRETRVDGVQRKVGIVEDRRE